jgi:beta-mannosidase
MSRQFRHLKLCTHSVVAVLSLFALYACSEESRKPSPREVLSLNGTWEFRIDSDSVWKTATVPGDVMTDLMDNGQMDSPYSMTNERLSQWVEKASWVYRHQFIRPTDWSSSEEPFELVFEGIDTYSTVILNGDTLGTTDNAHRAYQFPVSHLNEGLNTLKVLLHAAVDQGQTKLDASPWPVPVSNEARPQGQQTSSVSRKALYQFGWDWGPRLVSAGIWKSVTLGRVQSPHPSSMRMDLVHLDDTRATYRLNVKTKRTVRWSLNDSNGQPAAHTLEAINDSIWNLSIPTPQLWWPRGMGDQPLYTLHCDNESNNFSQRFGVRSLDWVRQKDKTGRSFECHINGQKVFARGANIVPADFFPVRARDRIEETLQDAVSANMNMVRIWGGAVYGEDLLYERCDELGLLVWQDFMFACCMVPGDASFAASVEAEARYNVRRLRNHPSLALWCGNNESEKAWESWGWQKQFGLSMQDSLEIQQAYDRIFGQLLPDIVEEESGQFYWASSPMQDPLEEADSGLSGDEHAWRVWFDTLDFDYYSDHGGRFASEYGLQSLPNRHTLEAVGIHAFDDEALQFRQRSKMEWLKPGLDGWGMMRIYAKRYAADPGVETGNADALDRWIYLTQLTQAEGLREALERHRFSRGKTSGSLYWQLNDVWPTVSWSTVDHAGRWKLAHHAVQHANQPQRLLIDRTDTDSLRTLLSNATNRPISGTVTIRRLNWSGQVIGEEQRALESLPFSETEWNWGAFDDWELNSTHEILQWTWEVQGETIDTGIQRFAKPSELRLPQAEVTQTTHRNSIVLSTDSLAYGVQLTSSIPGHFSSNGMTLIPHQQARIEFYPEQAGAGMGEVTVRHLAQFQLH